MACFCADVPLRTYSLSLPLVKKIKKQFGNKEQEIAIKNP